MFAVRERLFGNKKMACIIAVVALSFSYIAAHCCCIYIFHQPAKPDLSKLRKF